MRKIFHAKIQLILWLLVTAVIFQQVAFRFPSVIHAQELYTSVDKEISLENVTSIEANTVGSILRIYGEENKTYSVPIRVTTNCSIVLDNVNDQADITVAKGIEVHLILRGNNVLNHINANGGSKTQVYIQGETAESMLSANDIACPVSGSAQTGANVTVEGCILHCANLGCGGDGKDSAYQIGSELMPNASSGSHASPLVTIRSAELTVTGDIACGGNGVQSCGDSNAYSSHGGSSGEVVIDSSQVNVTGNISIGGRGGDGKINSADLDCTSGNTKSSSPVTVRNHSRVVAGGNVATQPDLPLESNGGRQSGFHGVTVGVYDSSLTAKDIASGGNGHDQIRYSKNLDAGITTCDIFGTAGGNGGTLIADHANITCETAVCGGNAGDYQCYVQDTDGTKTGDYECKEHPLDGNGGIIQADHSNLKILVCAAEKGNRWNDYGNPSTYCDSTFIGGTLDGTVYGDTIRTDLTCILYGGFIAEKDIRTSADISCANCVLQTSETLADQTVRVYANELSETVTLNAAGGFATYLGIGNESVKVHGSSGFSGKYEVEPCAEFQILLLEPYGVLSMEYGDVTISEHSYIYRDEVYDYNGDYTITGNSENGILTVESGDHHLTMSNTSFDTLTVIGNSEVTLQPVESVCINTVNVGEHAVLTLADTEEVRTDTDGLSIGACNGILQNENGKRLFPIKIMFEVPGVHNVRINGKELTVETDEQGLFNLLLAEETYDLQIGSAPLFFQSDIQITGAQQIRQSELTLFADISAGNLVIGENSVTLADTCIQTSANICIRQSTPDAHEVYVEKKNASITLDGVTEDIQIHLPEEFTGCIYNPSAAEPSDTEPSDTEPSDLEPSDIESTDAESTDTKPSDTEPSDTKPSDTEPSDIESTDAESTDTKPSDTEPSDTEPSDTDSKPQEKPAKDPSEQPDTDTSEQPDTDTSEQPDTDTSKQPDTDTSEQPDTDTSEQPDTDTSKQPDTDTSEQPGKDVSAKPNTKQPYHPDAEQQKQTVTEYPQYTFVTSQLQSATEDKVSSQDIAVFSSLKNISLVDAAVKDTYQLFTRKKLSFNIAREKNTDYYYKILSKGQNDSAGKWIKMSTDRITVSPKKYNEKSIRILFKAINGSESTIKKTPGFVMDTKKPTVTGVKNATFYRKKRTIRVSDNCGDCEVRLNGKPMKQTVTVQKRGLYLLTASDPAGNQRTVLFALL